MKTGEQIEGAFLALVAANRQKILRICRVYAWTPQDQEDLYQEVVFQIWRALPNLQEASFANTWLYRVTLNTAISFVRKKSAERRAAESGGDKLKMHLEERHQNSGEPNARAELLYEAITQLGEVEKALVTMFLDGLSYEEIGQVLNMATSHVGVTLHRAKKKLAGLMNEVAA